MQIEDLRILIKKHGFGKAKRKPWMDTMLNSEFYIKKDLKIELNSRSRFLKRLNDFVEVPYLYTKLEVIENLLNGERVK